MSKKKTNIKIKKSKFNLYNKRKSKTRQAVSLIITIVAMCVLGVVGYGVGKPIVKYFSERDTQSGSESSDTANASSDAETPNSSVPDSSPGSAPGSVSETSEPEPIVTKYGMYVLPENASASVEALNSALSAAKETDCTTALVTLKDDVGLLRYKSENPRIKDVSTINGGTLSAQQICDIIKKAGLTPAARISTLKDAAAAPLAGCYMFDDGTTRWLDEAPERGGKMWLDPFEADSGNYIAEVIRELSDAGFKEIVCTNVMFPYFHQVDIDQWLSRLDLNNMEKRCDALWSFMDKVKAEAAKTDTKLWVEMSGANLINPERGSLDSELANDPERLKTIPIIVEYTVTSEITAIYGDAKTFTENVKNVYNGAELAVLLKGLKGSALADAEKAFKEAGLTVFIEN